MLKRAISTSSTISGALLFAWWYNDFQMPKELPRYPFTRTSKANFEVVAQSTQLNNQIRPEMELLLSQYKPSWFYIHQTLVIAASCLVPAPHPIKYERIRVNAKTQTAGLLTYDVIRSPTPTSKALLIVPGVCGNSQEAYIMQLANEARLNGYNVLIINPTAPAECANDDEQTERGLECTDFSNNIYISQAVETMKE